MVAAVLASAGCATMANGTTQRIRVTSDPPGASVFLDGRPVGTTPTQITASRRNREPIIEIEKEGFQPAAYRLERREDWSTVLWDVALGVAITAATGRLMLEHDEATPPSASSSSPSGPAPRPGLSTTPMAPRSGSRPGSTPFWNPRRGSDGPISSSKTSTESSARLGEPPADVARGGAGHRRRRATPSQHQAASRQGVPRSAR